MHVGSFSDEFIEYSFCLIIEKVEILFFLIQFHQIQNLQQLDVYNSGELELYVMKPKENDNGNCKEKRRK